MLAAARPHPRAPSLSRFSLFQLHFFGPPKNFTFVSKPPSNHSPTPPGCANVARCPSKGQIHTLPKVNFRPPQKCFLVSGPIGNPAQSGMVVQTAIFNFRSENFNFHKSKFTQMCRANFYAPFRLFIEESFSDAKFGSELKCDNRLKGSMPRHG